MTGRVRPSDRAAWQQWATAEFGADGKAVELGTDAALQALIAGYDPAQAQDIARQTVAASHHGAGIGGFAGSLIGGLFHLIGIAFRLAALLIVIGIFVVIAYLGYLYLTGYFPNAPHL